MLLLTGLLIGWVQTSGPANGETSSARSTSTGTATLFVKATGMKNAQGKAVFLLYTRPDDFITNLDRADQRKVSTIENTTASVVFEGITPGEYAIAVFHDENDNGTVDYNFLGIPKETTGASRNPRPKLRAPRFAEAAFIVSDPQQSIEIRMNSQYD